MGRLKPDIGIDRRTVLFALTSVSLASASLLTYPYIPELGLAFYVIFVSLAVLSCFCISLDTAQGALLVSFNLVALGARAFVNQAGIATPGSEGSIWLLKVEQVWLGGYHIHHWYLGVLAVFLSLIALHGREDHRSYLYSLLGAGSALVIDEAGIILAGHTYHSWISYVSLLAFQALFLVNLKLDLPAVGDYF
ncbi:MAG: hypothetical protein ABEJ03_04880 [Candidatus Nanohaloarchaea archaeon]